MIKRAEITAQVPSLDLSDPIHEDPQSCTEPTRNSSFESCQSHPYTSQHPVDPSHGDSDFSQQVFPSPDRSYPDTTPKGHTTLTLTEPHRPSHYGPGYQITPFADQAFRHAQYHPQASSQTFQRSLPLLARGGLSIIVGQDPSLFDVTHPPEPASATTTTSSAFSPSTGPEHWPIVTSLEPLTEPRLRPDKIKTRRHKLHIDLAPGQPLTTQGTPRTRVYVACLQCRTRKVRCDGAKPVCHNCSLRSKEGDDCLYDSVPRRRGPDKNPGSRQRAARDVKNQVERNLIQVPRQRRRTGVSIGRKTSPHLVPSSVVPICPPSLSEVTHLPSPLAQASHNDDPFSQYSKADEPHVSSADDASRRYSRETHQATEKYHRKQEFSESMAAEPSLNFSRKIWWDSLLSLYFSPTSRDLIALTSSQRESAVHDITEDLRFLFQTCNYWFSFFHVPTFFGTYCDPPKRQNMQPSLILSLLAVSTFWQSSEIGKGEAGRQKAMRFRDEAQGALEASFNAGWVDDTLAQAAWLLAMFEICAHPHHSTERSTSSMMILDSIIHYLRLTCIDANDPHVSKFTPRSVPVANSESLRARSRDYTNISSYHNLQNIDTSSGLVVFPSHPDDSLNHGRSGCYCASITLGSTPSTPLWSFTPMWPSSFSEGEIRKESCRRLCWSSITLAAGHVSYSSACMTRSLNLFIGNPANHALLFSAECITPSPPLHSLHSPKDTVWALHDRAFLLWHSCMQIRHDTTVTDTEKAQFSVNAWLEADVLEKALNRHTCGIEKSMIFQGREYLFNARVAISYEFQRYIPLASTDVSGLFHRKKAEEWLSHQAMVSTRFMAGLHTVTGHAGNMLARRPFFVFWFMSQISRALSLWACDHTMTVALDVCKALLAPIDYLTALWPCGEQRLRYNGLRERLQRECEFAGLPPIPPPNFTLPERLV